MAPRYFFKSAETAALDGLMGLPVLYIVITSKHTILTTDDAGDKIAITVGVGNALAVNNGLSLCREVWPHGVEHVLDGTNLVECDGCSGIAFDTADALALRQVTAEALGQNVGGDENVANLNDGRKVFQGKC